ncbi:BTB/POZ domain-containing protein [Melia azedarach]|uniref:BTB/POZ domain-containing protein n=1 Tax=Melia azedarach TaxID=155640 RepID=A0ACC1Z2H6_MELAZ|nr:BTB/POZ domain-containing protein [Melia azedarach]
MAVCCDLEVDVNGEETFMVDKKIVAPYSGRLSKLFGKSVGSKKNLKVIFQDFPGGAESFELMLRFCYNNGKIHITPSKISFLHCAAQFMEMKRCTPEKHNLLEQTEKSLEEISCWTWPELLIALKQCQDFLPVANSSGVLERCIESLVGRLPLTIEASPCASTSSPDSSGFRFSCDTRSTESLKNSFSRANWWFEDLLALSPNLVEMVIKSMVSRKLDHVIISKFLFFYQKSKFQIATTDEKRKILETVIDMLYTLDRSSVSCKSLFGILRVALSLNISKSSQNMLEIMIGYQMDQATLDNLLVPSPSRTNYLYDVNLVVRFLKAFLRRGGCQVSLMLVKKVASLMDLYMAEVAPDPCLKPSKFLALAMALPDSARESHDEMYRAIDLYFEVHPGLSEEEKINICCALNYEKLSAQACSHLSQNENFPSKAAVQALMSQQFKLKSLLHTTNNFKFGNDSPCSFSETESKGKKYEKYEQLVLYAGKPDLSADNEKLRAHLQGMQWRVMELEKVCRKMQTQMTKIMKSRVTSQSNARSLPRLCS